MKTDRKRIQIVYDYAVKYGNFKKVAACTCNFESDWEIKHFFSPKWMTPLIYGMQLFEEISYQKTKLFHFINRVPRKHRIETFLEVRRRGLEDKGFISFTGGEDPTGENLDPKNYILKLTHGLSSMQLFQCTPCFFLPVGMGMGGGCCYVGNLEVP